MGSILSDEPHFFKINRTKMPITPPKTLKPPATPKEAIESRRNPCYGFTILADLQEHQALIKILARTRDAILKIIDPDRESKKAPIRSPLYIKQKFFHASVFGIPPLSEKKQYTQIYTSEKGALNPVVMDAMCETLQSHLNKQKPYLRPMRCELMEKDGTILARFEYKTELADDAPLRSLASQLDPDQQFSQWDTSNHLRNTTVAVAICVIDKEKMPAKLEAIQLQLHLASEQLKALGDISIQQFQFISSYDKRTLSLKHISMYACIEPSSISKI